MKYLGWIIVILCLFVGSAQASSVEEIQVKSFARNPFIVSAMKDLSANFFTVRQNNGLLSVDDIKEILKTYYQSEFLDKYNKKSPKKEFHVENFFEKLDDDAIALQYYYLVAKGSPEKGVTPNVVSVDSSQWTVVNTKIQPVLEKYRDYFHLIDIYLIDSNTGHVVYSTNKKIDFATNLKDGLFSGSELGKTYQAIMGAVDKETTFISNVEGYVPSFDEPYRFAGASIYDGESRIGVLIFQLPLGM